MECCSLPKTRPPSEHQQGSLVEGACRPRTVGTREGRSQVHRKSEDLLPLFYQFSVRPRGVLVRARPQCSRVLSPRRAPASEGEVTLGQAHIVAAGQERDRDPEDHVP